MSLFSNKLSFARPFALVALMSASVAFAGCGGGGGGHDDDDDNGNDQNVGQVTELTIASTPELDGMLAGTPQNPFAAAQNQPVVGDLAYAPGGDRNTFQAVFSFDLSQIPAGKTVRSARLSLYVRDVNGDPDAAIVLARMDHVNYGPNFPINFSPPVIDFNFDTINDLNTIGRRDLDVTDQVLADIAAGRSRSQYRLRGAIDNNLDAQADYTVFTDGEDSAGTGQLPLIILELE